MQATAPKIRGGVKPVRRPSLLEGLLALHGLSLQALADRAEIGRSTLFRLIEEERVPHKTTANAVRAALQDLLRHPYTWEEVLALVQRKVKDPLEFGAEVRKALEDAKGEA